MNTSTGLTSGDTPVITGRQKTLDPKLMNFSLSNGKLTIKFASNIEQLDEIQALRYQIFGVEMGSYIPSAHLGRDIDEFDDYCDHLMVLDNETDKIVGTYRLMNPASAKKAGRYYCAGEFDMDNLAGIMGRSVELGRSCVHQNYRTGNTINLLWQGLTEYVDLFDCDYLFGCASVYINNEPERIHKLTQTLLKKHSAPAQWQVFPKKLIPAAPFDENTPDAPMPPLLKGYLRAGVLVCGEPSFDEEFGCADYFIVQPMREVTERYHKRFVDKTEK